WGLAALHPAGRVFGATVLLNHELGNPSADVRRPLLSVLNAFWLRPTFNEALTCSQFEFEADQTSEVCFPVADPFRLCDLVAAVNRGVIMPQRSMYWVAGGGAIASRALRVVTRLGFALR